MGRQTIRDKLPVEQFIDWRREGLTHEEIGARVGYSVARTSAYGKEVLPKELQGQKGRRASSPQRLDIEEVLMPKDELLGPSPAKRVELPEDDGPGDPPSSEPAGEIRCLRCTILTRPQNPVHPGYRLCLHCLKELAGEDIREWYESGEAVRQLGRWVVGEVASESADTDVLRRELSEAGAEVAYWSSQVENLDEQIAALEAQVRDLLSQHRRDILGWQGKMDEVARLLQAAEVGQAGPRFPLVVTEGQLERAVVLETGERVVVIGRNGGRSRSETV